MTTCTDNLTPLIAAAPGAPLISTDGTWAYERTTDGLYRSGGRQLTAYYVIRHRPSDVIADQAGTLTAARRRTGDGTAYESLRYMTERAADGTYGPDLMARARVVLGILDGTIAPAGVEDSRCVCGGYLTQQAGQWWHVDTCDEEVHAGGPCPDNRTRHLFCANPVPAQCEHHHCLRANDINALPCEVGHDYCCGCCA